jgi:hypothetical protein
MMQIRMPQNDADLDAAKCCRSGCPKMLQIRMPLNAAIRMPQMLQIQMPQNAADPDATKCCRSGCRKMMRNRMPQNDPDAATCCNVPALAGHATADSAAIVGIEQGVVLLPPGQTHLLQHGRQPVRYHVRVQVPVTSESLHTAPSSMKS